MTIVITWPWGYLGVALGLIAGEILWRTSRQLYKVIGTAWTLRKSLFGRADDRDSR